LQHCVVFPQGFPSIAALLGFSLAILLGCENGTDFQAAEKITPAKPSVVRKVPLPVSEDEIEDRIRADIEYLASDQLAGRGPFSQGLQDASEYIAKQFQASGLKTDLIQGEPFQVFSSRSIYQAGEENRLSILDDGQSSDLTLEQFQALSPSSSSSFDLPMYFVGYGISSEEDNYDDYHNHDVAGHAVIVLRHEPDQAGRSGKFSKEKNSSHAYLSEKILNAINHQAAAVVLVSDSVAVEKSGDQLLDFRVKMPRGFQPSVPVVHVKRSVIDAVFQQQTGMSLVDWERNVDRTLQPQSMMLEKVRLKGKTDISMAKRTQHNVLAVVPGAGNLADEVIVVGAHYDHLGMGGGGSLAPWTRDVHNGADDNASGTAAIMETARRWATDAPGNRRTVLFVAFAAEEQGLIGSEYYVRHPLFDLEKTKAMINFDMVGRLRGDRLTVYGVDTAKQFQKWVDTSAQTAEIKTAKVAGGYGPSDHASFYGRSIPVLHYFTGFHSDYHRPSDDSEKINIKGIRKIVEFNLGILKHAATSPIDFNQQAGGSGMADLIFGTSPSSSTGRPSESSQPQRRSLGIRTSQQAGNLVVSQVVPGSVAAQFGLMRGDQLVSWNGERIDSLDQLRKKVSAAIVGQPVQLRILRANIELELEIKFSI